MITSKVWRGFHKNIAYEIVTHQLANPSGPWWNTYIILTSERNANMLEYLWETKYKRFKWPIDRRLTYQEPAEIWKELSWHLEPTFYLQEKKGDFRSIKIGDDYQHRSDYDFNGNLHPLKVEYLQSRCIKMIDELVTLLEGEKF